MSFSNGTVPLSDAWSGYLADAQSHLQNNSRLILAVLVNIPIIAILLNVIRQLVRFFFIYFALVMSVLMMLR